MGDGHGRGVNLAGENSIMRIEQTLHGYADGHRLLAGSIELPRQEKHLMLGLSDMSGRSMVSGFEEYITGYPLADGGYYAFARTWYAPEKERPGCVWTHSLLISEGQLGRIRDLGTLRRLFRRPVSVEARSASCTAWLASRSIARS